MSFIHSTITRAAAFTAAMFASPAMAADVTERGMSESDFPLVQELVSGVYAYSDTLNAGQLITTVSLIVVTSEGVVVVDGQNTIEQGEAMVSEIKKLTDQPVKYRVIASDHGDHVNSLPALKAAYPDMTIIATPISKAIMAENAELPPVDETVTQARTLTLGGVDIRVLNIGRGHTGGDLVAYLPASDVLFMGELYLHDVFPAMITAYPSDWVETIKTAQDMQVSWYVPGHGFVDDAPTLKEQLDHSLKATEHVISEAHRLRAAGHKCPDEKNCPAFEHAEWGEFTEMALFASQAPRALARVYAEIEGRLP